MRTAEGNPLTDREREVFEYVYKHARKYGFQPDHREIAGRLGFRSFARVGQLVRSLIRKGYLKRDPKLRSRALRFRLRPDGQPFRGFRDREDA